MGARSERARSARVLLLCCAAGPIRETVTGVCFVGCGTYWEIKDALLLCAHAGHHQSRDLELADAPGVAKEPGPQRAVM